MTNISDLTISMHSISSRRTTYRFTVSYHEVTEEGVQNWSKDFAVRDNLGNPTQLGRRMGIKCRDKQIIPDTPKWKSIQEYLYRLAWKHARNLSYRHGVNVIDNTTYHNN